MAFNLKSGNGPLPFKQMGSSPAKVHEPGHEGETKEVKGTSIFGKSPKEFVKSVGKLGLSLAKGAGEAASEAISGGLVGGLVGGGVKGLHEQTHKKQLHSGKLKATMTKKFGPVEKKRTIKSDIHMKPPYKKPVGPRAN